MSSSYAGLKRRLPDVLGAMGSWWDNVPRVGRYAIYLLLMVSLIGCILPRFFAPWGPQTWMRTVYWLGVQPM